MEKVIITVFTDPMMGLSYESEPVRQKLEKHYGDQISFRYVMAGLVQYGDRAVLINWLADFDSFVHVIGELSKG